MTQPDPTPDSVPAPQDGTRKTSYFAWIALGILLLASAASAVFVNDARAPAAAPAQPADIATLERRVEILETHVAALSEAPASAPQAIDTGLSATIKDLEAQIAQMQNQDKNSQQSVRKYIAAAFSFWDLREAAKTGRPFTTQLAALRAAAGDDAAIGEQAARLEPYAAAPPPTLPQLHDTLTAQEASLESAPPSTENSFWERALAAFHSLISVHPLHNLQFAALEKALDDGNGQAASDALKALPDDVQKKLAAWQTELADRNIIDGALQTLGASFTAASGNTP